MKSLSLFHHLPDYPVFYTPVNEVHEYLYDQRILISSFPYPSPTDARITRVVISTLHTPEDIQRIVAAIRQFSMHRR